MYISPDGYRSAFDEIRRTSLSHSTCKVVVFVSALDIDALCSAKMLANLFKSELIPHKISPVVGYRELGAMYKELDDDVTNVICVGCGATIDLETHFDIPIDEPIGRKIYVIDNHRPWNLDNLFGATSVVCLDDGAVDKLTDHREAYEYLIEHQDDDEENGVDNGNGHANGDTDHARGLIEDDGDQTDEDEPTPRQSDNKQQSSTQLLENYYGQGTSLTQSCTIQTYALLSSVGETTVNSLWLTVVGATSLDAEHPQIYQTLFPLLKDEVQRLCPPVNGHDGLHDGLHIETDYALFVLRHWSLYQAMLHSSYLGAKLQLWTEDGRKRLHKMLAKMGISLREAQEQWSHMHIHLKKGLRDKLSDVAGVYGIDEIIRSGVVRRYGYKGSVSAGDCVEAILALLQQKTDAHGDEHRIWVSNFWKGWDAMDSVNELMEGISKAKELQQAVVSAGTAIFEKKQIKDLRSFRLAVIREGPELDVFRNPLALARLGVWIAEGCAESHPVPLPLVIASLNTVSDTYLVLGMGPYYGRGDEMAKEDVYNRFGPAFQATATKINAKVRMDAFESCIIEVARDDLSRFLEALTLSGLV